MCVRRLIISLFGKLYQLIISLFGITLSVNNVFAGAAALGEKSMAGIDEKLIETIKNEILEHNPNVTWEDIAGQDFAKSQIKEIVVLPMMRPDLFTGLRASPKGQSPLAVSLAVSPCSLPLA